MLAPTGTQLDRPTLEHVIHLLEDRLSAVATYGVGGCSTCHDTELRGAILFLRRLLDPALATTASKAASSFSRLRRR